MTDLTALATKLAALISEDDVFVAGGKRVISHGDDPPAMVAILREVDNTVLERTLEFGLDDVTVSISAAGRRLRGVVAIDSDMPGKDKIIGHILSQEEPDLLKATGAMLNDFCANAKRITVLSGPPQMLGSSAEKGLSVATLAEVWQVNMDARAAPPMERFLTANKDKMIGHLYMSGNDVIGSSGDTARLQEVWDTQIDMFRKRHKAAQPKLDGPVLVCLDAVLGGQTSVAVGSFGKESCLFSYLPIDLPDLISSWNAVTS
ncbi:hypothetical protein [Yoonia sediminilitoris]|uniref:hypothetical protein n=1 Tax=Yoonia sediminilitoris TaxID=1286148 RepID=UPI001056ED3F|nr:hypothetical protein [Yoonia sediminilitoris]